jgi:hypothetical protein
VKGTVIGEDVLKPGKMIQIIYNLDEARAYLIETEACMYIAMTPSASVDPLDSAFVGEFELGELVAEGSSSDYVGNTISTTEIEFRNLISYKKVVSE